MPLSAGDAASNTGLAGEIYTQLQTLTFFQSGAAGEAFANKLAAAIVNHITAHATVLPTSLVAPGGGGPVTGTGSIT